MLGGRAVGGVAAFLLCAAALVGGDPVQAPGYNCPAKTCNKNPNCHCASHDIPGGLPATDIPQFIVLTNDDAITVTTMPVIVDITKAHNNPQGCELPATWFVSMNYTDYHLVQEVYMRNHEIATHTLHHVPNPDLFEIVGQKLWLNQTAHVPLEKIRGFRAPFLIHSPEQRTILQQNGFLYDSSVPEPFPSATSPDGSTRLWPYTMDYGLPQRCDLGTGPCSVNETHPGLWEFPMWDVQDNNGVVLTNMDPQGDLNAAYQREFDRNYKGNRAPVGVYVHAAWLIDPARAAAMNQFIEYALSHDNVWFVTMSEVIDWMKNPVSAEVYANQRKAQGCSPPTDMWFPSGKFCPSVPCVNGNWSDVACQCVCIAEFLTEQPGWCADPQTQACTVAKVFDDTTRTFNCPDGSVRAPPNTTVTSSSPDPSVASCGHPLQDFVGLGISGTQDNAALYTQALRAVDGLCDTCASARDPAGNYFNLVLPDVYSVAGLQLTVGESVKGAFVFVGQSSSNNGMDNLPCAASLDLPANTAVSVNCTGYGKYVTVAVPKDLVLCDIYVEGYPNAGAQASPSPSPTPVTGSQGMTGADGSMAGSGASSTNNLVNQLLNGTSNDSFATTSYEPQAQGGASTAGMDGVNPNSGPTTKDLTQQLTDDYNLEISTINSERAAAQGANGNKKTRKTL